MNNTDPPPTAQQRTARNLRSAMGALELKAGDLAKALAISPQAAGRRMNGRHDFKVSELDTIAAWLHMAPEELFPGPPAHNIIPNPTPH